MRRCLADRWGLSDDSGMARVGAALSSLAFVIVLGGARSAIAQSGPGQDPDGDFLCNAQEQILGTSADVADSDHDGFSDLEELARGTTPTSAVHFPTTAAPVHVGMAAHAGLDDRIHVLVAVHSTSMNPRVPRVRFGVQFDQRMIVMSNSWVAANSTLRLTTGAGGQGLVHLLDVSIDPAVVLAGGHLTFFAMVGIPGSDAVLSADTVQLTNVDGVPILVMNPPRPSPQQSPLQQGTIYIPLPTSGSGGGIPASWTPGSVCFQRSAPVAFNGAVVTQEVVSATCIEGWDGYCPPTCAATVGSTYQTVDPIVLLGG